MYLCPFYSVVCQCDHLHAPKNFSAVVFRCINTPAYRVQAKPSGPKPQQRMVSLLEYRQGVPGFFSHRNIAASVDEAA